MSWESSTLVRSTLQELEGTPTNADYQRLAGRLLGYATPGELEVLAHRVAAEGPFGVWLRGLYELVTRHTRTPNAFYGDHVSRAISRYSGGATAHTIIVAFCGKSRLLHGPTATILQYFPCESFDVLVLRDPDVRGFTKGIAGYANSFTGLIAKLRTQFAFDNYSEIRCFGCSSGGAAALAAGQLLGASRLVSFVGQPPSQSGSYGRTSGADELREIISAGPDGAGRAFAIFGADNAEDVKGAEALSHVLNLTLVPIEGVDDHNIIGVLHRSGVMSSILRKVGLL
jgi:hypothetical protein